MNEIKQAKQDKILADRMAEYDAILGARVGDWIREPDGRMSRATHEWNQNGEMSEIIQHGGGEHGQYYLGKGYLSYSGGLDTGIKKNQLKQTDEMKLGKVWFFKDDYHTAGNGIEYVVDFRVYEVLPGAAI